MKRVNDLLASNRQWAAKTHQADPSFFQNLARQQAPKFLWIGCSDSRVPATQIVDVEPGAIFVHRNVANVVVHTDLNALSTIQFAVDVLKVEHVLVVGHYGCGGVRAALEHLRLGLVDNWIRHVGDVAGKHEGLLRPLPDLDARHDRLCELNAIEQALNVCETTIVRDAWARGQKLLVHAWIYGLGDGLIKDLGFHSDGKEDPREAYRKAIDNLDGDAPEGAA
jgi:carbonic anhydrase